MNLIEPSLPKEKGASRYQRRGGPEQTDQTMYYVYDPKAPIHLNEKGNIVWRVKVKGVATEKVILHYTIERPASKKKVLAFRDEVADDENVMSRRFYNGNK